MPRTTSISSTALQCAAPSRRSSRATRPKGARRWRRPRHGASAGRAAPPATSSTIGRCWPTAQGRVRVRLPELTLCCVDTRDPALALWAMARCMAQIEFAEALLFTRAASVPSPPPGVRVIDSDIETIEAYSEFMLRGLADHVHSSHALIVQWDGFVRDASRWDRDFLAYDYIGAPWRD